MEKHFALLLLAIHICITQQIVCYVTRNVVICNVLIIQGPVYSDLAVGKKCSTRKSPLYSQNLDSASQITRIHFYHRGSEFLIKE